MKAIRRLTSLFLSAVMLGSLVQPVSAAGFTDSGGVTYHVSNSAGGGSDRTGDGSAGSPFLTVTHAMDAASDNGVRDLTIALGSNIEITDTLAFDGRVPKVTVQGNSYGITYRGDGDLGAGTAALVVSGGAEVSFEDMALTRPAGMEYTGRLLYVQNASASLSRTTVSNGSLSVSDVTDGGSAIHVASGGRVLLADDTLVNGNSSAGANASGAVFVGNGGELEITGAVIKGNSASRGAGVYVRSGGTLGMYSDGGAITVRDEIFIETGASASVGAAPGQSGKIGLARVYLDNEATASGGTATLDISGETHDAVIGIEAHGNYHDVYRLVASSANGYAIDGTAGSMDEDGWSDLCNARDIRYMDYNGVPGLYLYYYTLDATFQDVGTLTGITGKDIDGSEVSYYGRDVANSTVSGGALSVPGIVPIGSGDYEIGFSVDEAGKAYRIPTPGQIRIKLGGVTLINGQDYEYAPDYGSGTASLKIFAEALEDASGTLEFGISGEKYSLLTLQFNGPVYTMSTDVTGQKVTQALSVAKTVVNGGRDVSFEITRGGQPVPGVTVVLYREGTDTEAGTGVTDGNGRTGVTSLDPAYSYYYVLYYSDSFHVIERDRVSLVLSTLEGQKMASRCEFDEGTTSVSYTAAGAEDWSGATSEITGTAGDTQVTYYVDLARDTITFMANQGEATTKDTAEFTFDGEVTRSDALSKDMETNAATYGILPEITMTGYTFLGWFTAPEGGELVTSDSPYDTVSSEKTLHAHWAPNNDIAYQVRHWVEYAEPGVNPGYASGTETETVDGTTYYLWKTDSYADGTADATMDDVAHLELDAMSPEGYTWWTLDGFTARAQRECKALADGSSAFDCHYDRKTYTMTYDPTEGGMKAGGSTMSHKFGEDVGSMLVAERSGYVFGGWYKSLGGDAEIAVTATSWYTWTEDVTVYAKWTNSDTTYTLRIMAEDKSIGEDGLAYADGTYTQSKIVSKDDAHQPLGGTSDVEMTVGVASISALSLDGFTYIGYSLDGDENGTGMVLSDSSYVVKPNEHGTTVVYLYHSRNKAEVTFYDDNGSGAGVHKAVTVVYGDKFGAALPEACPAKPGYDFAGWADSEGEPVGAGTSANGYTGGGNCQMGVYPVWTARTYYVTYVPGEHATLDASATGAGSTINSAVSGGYTVAKPVTYGEPMGAMPTTSKTGYEFLGWMLEDGPGAGGYVTEGTVADVNSVVARNDDDSQEGTYALRAVYEPYRFTLVLDAGDGTVSPASLTVTYDAAIPDLPDPVLSGYTFTGWMLDTGDGTGKRIESGDTWACVAANGATITARAMYLPNRYEYRLDLNDAAEGNGSTTASLYDMNISGVEIPFDGNYADALNGIIAQRNGYVFLGWSLSRDKADLVDAGTVNRLAEGSTLYAIWKPVAYALEIRLNGGELPREEWFNFNSYAAANYASYADTYGGDALVATYDAVTDTWTVPVVFDSVYGGIGELSKTNYRFEGYRVSAPGWYDGDTPVLDGEVIRELGGYTDHVDGSVLLDAVWTPYFDFVPGDGAAFDGGETRYGHILRSDLDELPVAVRDGWTFLGWYDDADGRYADLTSVVSLDECRSFRAVFTPNITFDGNGGKVIVDDAEHDSYTIGLSILSEKYGKFFDARMDGRTFTGWIASDTSDMTAFENILNRAAPLTLTAGWDMAVTFRLPSGAYWADGSTGDRTFPAREVGEWDALPEARLDGYTFVGWQDSGSEPVTPAGLSASDGSVTVYPLFRADGGGAIDVAVTNYAPSRAVCAAPANGWAAGENTFTVACDVACAVALVRDGETAVLSCEERADGIHAFTAELQDHDGIVIVMVGDANLDGRLTAADLVCLSQSFGGEYTLSGHAGLAADENGDGRLTTADLVRLSQYFGGEYVPEWRSAR